MKRYNRFVMVLLAFGLSCAVQQDTSDSKTFLRPASGSWLCTLDLGDGVLPFDLEFISPQDIIIRNSEEEIHVTDITYKNDSLFIVLPIFNSAVKAVVHNSDSISGFWYNYSKGKDYKIPLKARHGDFPRFSGHSTISSDLLKGEKWEVTFSPGSNRSYKAIGIFNSNAKGEVTGTFITETGDYRYLEGNMNGNAFSMSAFDGSHAFLFNADMIGSDSLIGKFYSGTHWQEDWVAKRNPSFELKDPYSLTYIKEGYDGLTFSFPDLDSNMISYPSAKFDDKVLVVQIMGSWCPNCMDETKVLTDLHNKYQDQGLQIVSLCFEKPLLFKDAVSNIIRHKSYFNSQYTFLYAGQASKSCANNKLPMLNKIMSFPTSIFIDKKRRYSKDTYRFLWSWNWSILYPNGC